MRWTSRLIVVANRLPVTLRRIDNGQLELEQSSGGLVTALRPLLRKTGGCWIGWPGLEVSPDVPLALAALAEPSFEMRPVSITEADHREFYNGCCNEIIWPLFHDFPSECRFESRYWEHYRQVTEQFADTIETTATPRDFIWVHDYHLMLVAAALRARESRLKLAYFHHIPFPAPEMFGRIPWRVELLEGLLKFNQLAFQTRADRRNFMAAVRRWLPGKVRVRRIRSKWLLTANESSCVLENCPISIDYESLNHLAGEPDVAAECEQLRRQLPFQSIILGVDRLDYTKGILERLKGYCNFLEQNPDMRGVVTLLQLVVPSREQIPGYQSLRKSIEQLISQINGRFCRPGWNPVVYMYRSFSERQMAAYYRAADVALVTSIRDGMNLVAKEYCACRNRDSGVLILSEFTGAAEELGVGALLVNPHDSGQITRAISMALRMSKTEMSQRMSCMRAVIRSHSVWQWSATLCGSSLRAASGKTPEFTPAIAGALAAAKLASFRPDMATAYACGEEN